MQKSEATRARKLIKLKEPLLFLSSMLRKYLNAQRDRNVLYSESCHSLRHSPISNTKLMLSKSLITKPKVPDLFLLAYYN